MTTRKTLLGAACAALALSLLAGCAHVPAGASKINLITEDEAKANHCRYLTFAGSASSVLINGKARNTAQILRKALRVPDATHITYTKGEAGYAFTKANIWACPNPNLKTQDAHTRELSLRYLHHD